MQIYGIDRHATEIKDKVIGIKDLTSLTGPLLIFLSLLSFLYLIKNPATTTCYGIKGKALVDNTTPMISREQN